MILSMKNSLVMKEIKKFLRMKCNCMIQKFVDQDYLIYHQVGRFTFKFSSIKQLYSFEGNQIEQNLERQGRYRLGDRDSYNETSEIRSAIRQFNYQQIIYRRPNDASNRNHENGLSIIFKRIVNKWNRGNSIHPLIKDDSCSI